MTTTAWIMFAATIVVGIWRFKEYRTDDMNGHPGPTTKYLIAGLIVTMIAAYHNHSLISMVGSLICLCAFGLHTLSNQLSKSVVQTQ